MPSALGLVGDAVNGGDVIFILKHMSIILYKAENYITIRK